jgi:hypothetical protein
MTLNSKIISVDNLVLNGILKAMESAPQWSGTMTDLDASLVKTYNRNVTKLSALPGSPSALRVVVNRITNRLRSRGISVRFNRSTDRTRTRYVKLVK